MSPEEERYRWLRDGKSHFGGYCGSAPFVMLPDRSRLYAIAKARAEILDLEVDRDIFWSKAQDLFIANEVVERGLLPAGAHIHDDKYHDALVKLTQQELGWSNERVLPLLT